MTKSRGILAPRQPWTDDQVEQLRARYPHEKTEDIATDLKRTVGRVYQKAAALGLKKSAEYLSSPDACRLRRGDHPGVAHQFKPGQPTWNKGMSYAAGGRSLETQFKPGSRPHTWRPIGSVRVTQDGTLQRKISDAKGNTCKRWRGVHELVWVALHGPVPPKHIVVFKPGMRTVDPEQITIDRVECITLAENMKRNTRHNLPKPLADLIALKAAVTRQINKRTTP